MYKKYDIWLEIGYGTAHILGDANRIMTKVYEAHKDGVLINGLHRIGCAYRVQLETTEETANLIKAKIIDPMGLKMEETRGFSAS